MDMKPEYCNSEEFENRFRKLHQLRELGIDPYPPSFHPTHGSFDLINTWGNAKIGGSAEAEKGETPFVRAAGRLVLFRAMGKNAFAHMQDKDGRIQLMFNRDATHVEGYTPTTEDQPSQLKFIEKMIDIGDIIGVEGYLFHTLKGELTIFVKKVVLLTKSLLSLPEKHSGLCDKEVRYRK